MSRPVTRVLIEQAIARGEELDRICEQLRVAPKIVGAVWRAMDEAVTEQPARPPKPARVPKPRRNPAKHGTRSGYALHRRLKEDACAACRQAETDYQRPRVAQRRAA